MFNFYLSHNLHNPRYQITLTQICCTHHGDKTVLSFNYNIFFPLKNAASGPQTVMGQSRLTYWFNFRLEQKSL